MEKHGNFKRARIPSYRKRKQRDPKVEDSDNETVSFANEAKTNVQLFLFISSIHISDKMTQSARLVCISVSSWFRILHLICFNLKTK